MVKQFNAENISSRYGDVVLPDGEPTHPRSKDSACAIICNFTDKDIKLPKCSRVLNCCSECPGVFVPYVEMIGDEDANLSSIIFCHYKNISSCYLYKQ